MRDPIEQMQDRLVDKQWFIRFLEIFPGTLSWLALILPIVLSLTSPVLVAYFIIAFDLYWTIKSFRQGANLIRGYDRLHRAERIKWNMRLGWVTDPIGAQVQSKTAYADYITSLGRMPRRGFKMRPAEEYLIARQLRDDVRAAEELSSHQHTMLDPKSLYNVVFLATYNESLDILEPSVKAMIEVDYPLSQLMLVIAYEERGGAQTKKNADYLIKTYGHHFAYAKAIEHPNGIVGEVIGKGGNITYAGRAFTSDMQERGIAPEHIIVTTFDSDHRASKNYFSYLSYLFATDPNRDRKSYQPIPMFYNNIWDVPAPMRVIAAGNSFWLLMETMRPHRLRNFAAHAQSLSALIATDYWSVTTIVEDGHQYWRSYFAYDGDHQVEPVFTPIYQDAVLADTYLKTFRAQYLQQRRWAWGVSDFPYAVRMSMRNRRIPWSDKVLQLFRLLEGHFSWATASVIITTVAWLPLVLNRHFSYMTLAHQLPIITSRIMQIASFGIFITIYISLISLPPRPKRYGRTRSIAMALQWVLLPVTAILLGSLAAFDSQTRLMLGKKLGFYVTEKSVKK
jgi:cellulose synthase/poly-beta-1,6-N-acetylglucosamine synthase-like glycosyltransferase